MDRVFDILELLSREQHGLNLTEIGNRLDLHKSTVYRLLQALKQRGYIEKSAQGSYRLGMEFIELSSLYLNNLELKTEAQPVLRELSSLSGNTAFLATVQEDEVVYIDKMETFNSLRKYSIIGQRAPLYCTALGKSILTGKTGEQIRSLYRDRELKAFTAKTIRSVDALIEDVEKTRRRGWSLDDEEYEQGLRCIGAPIRDYRNVVIAAVSTSGYATVITSERVGEIAAYVVKAARDISQRMGYRSQ
ncbi:MAG: IclR family transcriptional regulator [Spirochaetales bacterium]|nr:IclR family transcriptional regulator [Spirochaetales bacterium]